MFTDKPETLNKERNGAEMMRVTVFYTAEWPQREIIAVCNEEDYDAALLDILHGRIADEWGDDNPPTFDNLDAALEYCEENDIELPQEETLFLFKP